MKEPKDPIIFPLDVSTFDEAKKYISLLSDHVGMFKVGLELFIKAGPEIVTYTNAAGGAKIFLDLKLHDIPVTVYRAVKSIAGMDVALATVHCGESKEMLEKAVEGSGGKVGILGVTVLTSVSPQDIKNSGFKKEFSDDISGLVLKRAEMAKAAGCTGIVCSGKEVAQIKSHFGKDFIAVTPGIRPLGDGVSNDDQARITTPADAIKKGADYLVIGRPIRDADDPVDAAKKIAGEIKSVL